MTSSMYHSPDWKMGKREKRNLGEECQLFPPYPIGQEARSPSSELCLHKLWKPPPTWMDPYGALRAACCHPHLLAKSQSFSVLAWFPFPRDDSGS
ncbi:hypothetical protein T310_2492 [Rasamsonia emersonii CBS 393.64]|uniref:Uncharacterized protein n=1 Tax=Rasamsonia emersonii (strain ATCC 16479 / CBS 393.64 / IMI 116815) TaxID=1408163 RepID=A0A0F4Z004_RASE3|nr:hypothetical protein T310_2492 [Rasamsonia emersonii CBS 393.64]KKA23426.1 hypothetical protein T310_2492 [Rasamsonia emersonii CBS 393.64]